MGTVQTEAKSESVAMLQKHGVRKDGVEFETQSASGTWSKENREGSINRLMQSSTRLLKSGVTPDVATFAQSTIDAIEGDAIPAIEDEHKMSVTLLEQAYAKFAQVNISVSTAAQKVSELTANETLAKEKHIACRNDEQDACDKSTACNNTLANLKQVYDSKELLMTQSKVDIGGAWCDADVDPLSKEVYTGNVRRFETYVKRKEEAWVAWQEYQAKIPVCNKLASDRWEKKKLCDQKQTVLESRSCARARKVQELNELILEKWNAVVASYSQTVEQTEAAVADRKVEYTGIYTVKCLLENIHNHSEAGKPCDESTHPDEVASEISLCHTNLKDTTHLDIEAKSTPETPPPIALEPFPCGENYAGHAGYDTLPACASARACSSHGCSLAEGGSAGTHV